jgi:hypothetical protein
MQKRITVNCGPIRALYSSGHKLVCESRLWCYSICFFLVDWLSYWLYVSSLSATGRLELHAEESLFNRRSSNSRISSTATASRCDDPCYRAWVSPFYGVSLIFFRQMWLHRPNHAEKLLLTDTSMRYDTLIEACDGSIVFVASRDQIHSIEGTCFFWFFIRFRYSTLYSIKLHRQPKNIGSDCFSRSNLWCLGTEWGFKFAFGLENRWNNGE